MRTTFRKSFRSGTHVTWEKNTTSYKSNRNVTTITTKKINIKEHVPL